MATQLKPIEPTVEEAVSLLVEQTQANPVAVFTDEAKFSDFYTWLKEETDRHVYDLTTVGGRKAIASLAFRVTKAKTTLDKAGLGLTEEARQMIATVNASRKKMTAELDHLAEEVRRPLTEWEEAEKARIADCETAIAFLKSAAVILADDTLETILTRGAEVKAAVIDAERYGSFYEPAMDAKRAAFFALKEAHGRLTKEAEERAEAKRVADDLAEMKREKEEREQREADERRREQEARDALKRQSDYASAIIRHIRECREARIDGKTYAWAICLNDVENRIETGDEAVKVFGDRAGEVEREAGEASVYIRQQMADEAEQHRKDVAEQAVKDARDQADREREEERRREREEAQAKIDEANKRARDLEEAEELRKRQAEQKERDDKIEADRLAEIEAKRVANINHRTRVRTGIEQAFMARGADDATAHKIAGDIIAGLIANVEVKF